VQALEQAFQADAAWSRPPDPALEHRFQRIKAKLMGFSQARLAVSKYPESDKSVPGHYARAYAYHVGGYSDKALTEAEALLATDPNDPYFLELKGQILLESGKPKEAIAPLRAAAEASGQAPMIAAMLGHALVASEDRANLAEAKQVLRTAVGRDNQDPFAWYQLGIIYDREGDAARAALATAERSNLTGEPRRALASAEMAMRGIPPGSPDWLRAQDIAMVSKAELQKTDKKERRR
jgi:predicted Zn-dependent protease